MSSGEVWVRAAGGFRILGAGIQGSFRWASPSTNTDDTCLYFAAFLRMDAIQQINYYKNDCIRQVCSSQEASQKPPSIIHRQRPLLIPNPAIPAEPRPLTLPPIPASTVSNPRHSRQHLPDPRHARRATSKLRPIRLIRHLPTHQTVKQKAQKHLLRRLQFSR